MKIGDFVMVLPAHSIRFAGRWGRIVEINPDDMLPIKVQFNENVIPYKFSRNELLTVGDYSWWSKQGEIYCEKCGKNITGQFTYLCEDCSYPIGE